MSEQPKRMTAEEMVAERAYDPEICQVFTDERRQVNAYHARVIAKSYAKQEVAQVTKERDEALTRIALLERKLSETYASRSALDCGYAGPYMEPDMGTKSHCPAEKPCQRCTLEKERDEARAEAWKEARDSRQYYLRMEKAERKRDEWGVLALEARLQLDSARTGQADALQRIEVLEQKLLALYSRCESLDCQYAGAHGESDGASSHCPPQRPCQRCTLERERDEARKRGTELRCDLSLARKRIAELEAGIDEEAV